MTIDYLFLARHGATSPDGTFTVFAGGLDTITVSECPGSFGIVIVGRLSRIVGQIQQYRCNFDLLDPNGMSMFADEPLLPMNWMPVDPATEAGLLGSGSENFLLNFTTLPFDAPGQHQFVVRFTNHTVTPPDQAEAQVPLTIRVRNAANRTDQLDGDASAASSR